MKPQLFDHQEMLSGRLLSIYNNSSKVRFNRWSPRFQGRDKQTGSHMINVQAREQEAQAALSELQQSFGNRDFPGSFPGLARRAAWTPE